MTEHNHITIAGEMDVQRVPSVARNHKDRLFRRVFSEKENLLALYNAINHTEYSDPEAIIITTIDDAIFMGMKNDQSFLVDSTLNFYEQQSTICPNMPLRGLLYAAKVYEKLIEPERHKLYGSKTVNVSAPRYIVLYNGEAELPDCSKLYLSDAFTKKDEVESGEFQWTATVLNINLGNNKELLAHCKPLLEYSQLLDKVRRHRRVLSMSEAVNQAVKECIAEGIMEEYLKGHRAEVLDVILTEYDEKATMEMFFEEGEEKGRKEGEEKGRKEGSREEKIGIAGAMKEKGLPEQLIMECTGLSAEEIGKL